MLWRWAVASALLVVEYLLVSFLFDAAPLSERAGFTALLGFSGLALPLAFTAVTTLILIGDRTLIGELGSLAASTPSLTTFWLRLGFHALAFVAFFATTAVLFAPGEPLAAATARVVIAAWVGAGALSVVLLLSAVVPLGMIGRVLRRNALALGVALGAGLAALLSGLASADLWEPLNRATLGVVVYLLTLISDDVSHAASSATVTMEGFWVNIAPECSGYEGIGLMGVFLAVYFHRERHTLRFPNALLLIPIGLTVIWAANSLRVATLIAIGARYSADVALGAFHSKAGWLLFCALALGVVALAQRSPLLSKRLAADEEGSNPTAAFLAPLLTLIALSMATGLLTNGFDTHYWIPVAGAAAVLVTHCRQFDWRLGWSAWPAGIGAAVFVAWLLLVPSADPSAVDAWQAGFAELSPFAAALWLIARVLGSVVIVPVVEELAFRGYLLRRLVAADFTAVQPRLVQVAPLILSSVAFGLVHQQFAAAVLAGIGYGIAYARRGRIGDSILAHAMTNALIAAYVLSLGEWSLWL